MHDAVVTINNTHWPAYRKENGTLVELRLFDPNDRSPKPRLIFRPDALRDAGIPEVLIAAAARSNPPGLILFEDLPQSNPLLRKPPAKSDQSRKFLSDPFRYNFSNPQNPCWCAMRRSMQKTSGLKLVMLFDRRTQTCCVCSHNLGAEDATQEVADLCRDGLPAFMVDQRSPHTEVDPDECPACRADISQSIKSLPTFECRKRTT